MLDACCCLCAEAGANPARGPLFVAPAGIEPKPDFTVPDVAERNRYPQLAPAGLGPSGIQHPRPQGAELELADAAFHAQQQAIVGTARVIDAVRIDHTGADETT